MYIIYKDKYLIKFNYEYDNSCIKQFNKIIVRYIRKTISNHNIENFLYEIIVSQLRCFRTTFNETKNIKILRSMTDLIL